MIGSNSQLCSFLLILEFALYKNGDYSTDFDVHQISTQVFTIKWDLKNVSILGLSSNF